MKITNYQPSDLKALAKVRLEDEFATQHPPTDNLPELFELRLEVYTAEVAVFISGASTPTGVWRGVCTVLGSDEETLRFATATLIKN
jgi:hypothetical protein